MRIQRADESEPMMKPHKRKRSFQKWVVTFVPITACVGNLSTEHMATGVKLAGLLFRLNQGKIERFFTMKNRDRKQTT